MEELKKCPFCGGEVILECVGNWVIRCSNCGLQMFDFYKDKLLSSWNTRQEPEGWISVKDRLPGIGQKVILFSNGVVQEETIMFDMADKNDLETECFWSRDDLDECPELQQCDFWQPLPAPPKE